MKRKEWHFRPEDNYAGPAIAPWFYMAGAALVYVMFCWWALGK